MIETARKKEIYRTPDSTEPENESNEVHIQPSESDSGGEENVPGRTPGKAEGSSKIVERDLRDKEGAES